MATYPRMAWYSASENGTKQLYLCEANSNVWRLYSSFPKYRQPEIDIPGASKGFPTAQHLLKLNWKYVNPSEVTNAQ